MPVQDPARSHPGPSQLLPRASFSPTGELGIPGKRIEHGRGNEGLWQNRPGEGPPVSPHPGKMPMGGACSPAPTVPLAPLSPVPAGWERRGQGCPHTHGAEQPPATAPPPPPAPHQPLPRTAINCRDDFLAKQQRKPGRLCRDCLVSLYRIENRYGRKLKNTYLG